MGDHFRYRSADGSNNGLTVYYLWEFILVLTTHKQNVMYPHLGASGSHYARTVTPQRPDCPIFPTRRLFLIVCCYIGLEYIQCIMLIMPALMKREGPAKDHQSRISSTLFHFATIIIHGRCNSIYSKVRTRH